MDFPILSDPTDQERQAALAAALRRQQTLGVVGQLTGDDVLGRVGTGLIQSAEKGQEDATAERQHRLTLALNAQKDREQRDYQQQQLGMEGKRLAIESSRANQENVQPVQTAQGLFGLDRRTGKLTPLQAPGGDQLTAPPKASTLEKPGDEQKALDEMLKHVGAVRGNPVIVKNKERIQGFQRLRTLGEDDNGQPRELGKGQYREFNTALATAIAPGSPGEHQIDELAQRTLGMDWAAAKSYISQHPEAAGVKEFVRLGLETARREEATVGAQNLQAISETLPFMAPTLKRYPQAWNAMAGLGIRREMVDPETFLPIKPIDPVAAGHDAERAYREKTGGADKATRKAARIQELIDGGQRDPAVIHKTLKDEGLL